MCDIFKCFNKKRFRLSKINRSVQCQSLGKFKAISRLICHSACMSAVLAESLFRAGFNHTSLLMTTDIGATANRRGMGGILDLVAWFVDHGEDLNSSIPRVACSGGATSEWGARWMLSNNPTRRLRDSILL